MKKLVTGLTIAAVVCGGSTIALASKAKSMNESNNNKNIRTEIENYIVNKYGNDWANSLYNKNGEDWDDILDRELENKFGHKYDDIIENLIDNKEHASGLDDIDDKIESNKVQNTTTSNSSINNNTVSNNINSNTTTVNKKSEIQSYIVNKYGNDWANNLYKKNGSKWDDILENELKNKFGHKYEDMIENIIDAKENTSGLDYDDDRYDDRYDD